jgi:D-amino-acid oxidase
MKIAVVGAGFLGCTLSLILSKDNDVDLFEKTNSILSGASSFNQMRFHNGYHYPRSQKTLNEIKHSKKEFIKFFKSKVFGTTKNFYSIPYKDSKTSPEKYIQFLKKNKLFFKEYKNKKFFSNNIAKSFLVDEKILNYFKFKKVCEKKISESKINLMLNQKISRSDLKKYDKVFVCTYSENNNVLKSLGLKAVDEFKYELVEKIVIKLPKKFKDKSFVVIDGSFVCCDPYLGTKYHLLSDVHNSKIEISKNRFYKFRSNIKKYANKNAFKNLNISKFKNFKKNSSKFLPFLKDAKYVKSMFTIRTLIADKEKTDERTTNIKKINNKLYVVLTGKWNTTVHISKKIKKDLSR